MVLKFSIKQLYEETKHITMVNFLNRTSSHKVLEIIMKEQYNDTNVISDELLKLGHKRQKADIRGMVGILEHFRLLEKEVQKQSQILIEQKKIVNYN